MRATKQMQVTGALGLCLLTAPLLRPGTHGVGGWLRAPSPLPALPRSGSPPPPRSPSVEAWLAGWQYWREAGMAVNREREALEAWDPATGQMDQEGMRRQLMAQDRGGHLRRARQAARQAILLAQNQRELYRATALLAMVEHEAGQHEAELRHARVLVALWPHTPMSLMYLHRAEKCMGLETRSPSTPCLLPGAGIAPNSSPGG